MRRVRGAEEARVKGAEKSKGEAEEAEGEGILNSRCGRKESKGRI